MDKLDTWVEVIAGWDDLLELLEFLWAWLPVEYDGDVLLF